MIGQDWLLLEEQIYLVYSHQNKNLKLLLDAGNVKTEKMNFKKICSKHKNKIQHIQLSNGNLNQIDMNFIKKSIIFLKRINYNKTVSIENYAKLVEKIFFDLGVEIILEPGRLLVGNSGIIISKVIRVKKGEGKNFLIIDCGMNNILRPSMYNAFHDIKPVITNSIISKANFDIVGPICESSDIFLKNYKIQKNICRDDLVVICSTGAYGSCMSSNYNLRDNINSYFSDTI